MKQLVLNQIGYYITGEATLNLWGGGKGTINIEPTILKTNKVPTKEDILKANAINDNGFGCESIDEANIDIYEVYERDTLGDYVCSYNFNKNELYNYTKLGI
jgi:hypothetical protein